VLRGECGNRGKAVQPMRSEGLEIGLNAGATARIGTGNRQNAERASVGKRHESKPLAESSIDLYA